MEIKKRMLSKSQIQLFLQCPFKWKCIYIDELKSRPSPQQERGIEIHKQIEEFYKNIDLVKINDKKTPVIVSKVKIDNNFLEFEKKRINMCLNKEGVFEEKYFKPIFQELKVQDEELMLRGIIDVVYINPKDDGTVIIDFKTGKFYKDNLDNYRFELVLYAELLKHSGKVDDVKYIGMLFIDSNKLFFERLKEEDIKKMYSKVDIVRREIEKGEYKSTPNQYCKFCEFVKECDENGIA